MTFLMQNSFESLTGNASYGFRLTYRPKWLQQVKSEGE